MKKRFHVLQHLDAIDTVVKDANAGNNMPNMHGCINQPRLATQVKNKLVGKNKNGFLDGESKDVCNMISDPGVTTTRKTHPKIVSVCTSLLDNICKLET